jgi:hypothetical protein
MEKTNILEVIDEYGLAIRRLPRLVIGTYEMRYYQEGDEVVRAKNGRCYTRRITVPKNAGMYMVKEVNNTSSTVSWDTKKDNLAKTLEESVELFLKNKRRKIKWLEKQ